MPFSASSGGWARLTRVRPQGRRRTSPRYAINGIASRGERVVGPPRYAINGSASRGELPACHDDRPPLDIASPAIAKAAGQVVVDQPDALHHRVDDGRTDEAEPPPAKLRRQGVGHSHRWRVF